MIKKLLKALLILIIFGILGTVAILGMVIYISFDLPQINSLADYNPAIPSKVYSKDGELLLEIGKENREVVNFDQIPTKITQCFVAAEDDNFYNHSGVDYMGILRAMIKNIQAGRIVQGGSTLTQQVAKSLLLSNERTYSRKIKDLLLAQKIESKFSKDEILFLYLNQVYLGGGYYGIKSAFKGYFDKELSEATIAECALVAGLLVAPGKYSPYVNPEYAKNRQEYVLGRLLKTQKISQVEYESAIKENIRMKLKKGNAFKAGYFTDWIRQKLIEELGSEEFLTNGYEVITSLDWSLQKVAEQQVLEGVKEIDKRQGFNGPLGYLANQEEIIQKFIKERKNLYKEKSDYFTFFVDGSTRNQFDYEDGEIEKIFEKDNILLDQLNSKVRKNIVLGQDMEDPFLNQVDLGENYEAVVTNLDDKQRMIYVSFLGLKGMIPFDNFKWAHERVITEERNFFPYITKPSSILKVGDIILVNIKGTPKSVWSYIWKEYKDKIKDNDLITQFKNQKFFLLELDQVPQAQGALLSVSPKTGEIISLVGGVNFKDSQFNRVVQSNRQPGSAFKPLIYAVGLENGYTPASILMDTPQALAAGIDDDLQWKPRNYDGKFNGEMTFRRALETSRNIPTIRLVQDTGVDNIISFVNRLKLNTQLPSDLSISLGSFGMNLLDLIKAYSIFPNGGKKLKLKSVISIKDRFGKVYSLNENASSAVEVVENTEVVEKSSATTEESIDESTVEKTDQNPFLVNLTDDQVYDHRLAYIMTNLMKGIISNGTGMSAREIGTFIGGKTGTTNNYLDAWFIGFSSDVVTGVWTGFDDNKTLGFGETGAKAALPIWKNFMQASLKKYPEMDFKLPSGIINVAINRESGKIAKSNEKNVFIESFVEGTEPGNNKQEKEDQNGQGIVDTILDDDYDDS